MTEVFTADTTIDRPVDVVWARLIDWDSATRWMPGVDALRAQGPTKIGTTLIFTTRGKERTGQIAAPQPRAQHHPEVRSGRGDGRLRLHLFGVRRWDARAPVGRLQYGRSSSATQPADQVCHPQGGQRPARRVRSHLHPGVNSGSVGRVPSMIGARPPRTGPPEHRWSRLPGQPGT
jgi:hypothetical protein